MKIVHIEDFFHPDAGYQINILPKYMVKQGHEVYIISSEMNKIPDSLTKFFGREKIEECDNKYYINTGVKIIRFPIKAYISGRVVFDRNMYKLVEKLSPDILYVHGNDTLTGIIYTLKSKKLNYPLVLDSHMLEMASTNPFNKFFRMFYKIFITPILKERKIQVIRTQDDTYVEKCLGIPLTQSPFISVGSDTQLFHSNDNMKREFRKKLNISDSDFVVVYTGKLDEAKGGLLLAETFEKKFNNCKNQKLVLIVVGNTHGQYGTSVESLFKKTENRVIRFSTQKYMDLAQFYQAADLAVFPKQCSLSFYDAQACGLPVVSEDNNINIDRLKFNNGFNFRSGNINDFRDKITKCIEMNEAEYEEMKVNSVKYVQQNFNYDDIAGQYMELLTDEYNKFHLH